MSTESKVPEEMLKFRDAGVFFHIRQKCGKCCTLQNTHMLSVNRGDVNREERDKGFEHSHYAGSCWRFCKVLHVAHSSRVPAVQLGVWRVHDITDNFF